MKKPYVTKIELEAKCFELYPNTKIMSLRDMAQFAWDVSENPSRDAHEFSNRINQFIVTCLAYERTGVFYLLEKPEERKNPDGYSQSIGFRFGLEGEHYISTCGWLKPVKQAA